MVSELCRHYDDRQLDLIYRWPTLRSKAWTAAFLESATNDTNIVAVLGVGSAVRADVPSVDLDLVVIAEHPEALKKKAPIEIDLRIYAADQVGKLIQEGNDLLGWTVNYGKVLWQRDGFWDSILQSWKDRVPLPSVELTLRRGDIAFRRFTTMVELGDADAAYEQALSYVTHLARAELIKRGRYPASRPELPKDLRTVGCSSLADLLDTLINRRPTTIAQLTKLLASTQSAERVAGH